MRDIPDTPTGRRRRNTPGADPAEDPPNEVGDSLVVVAASRTPARDDIRTAEAGDGHTHPGDHHEVPPSSWVPAEDGGASEPSDRDPVPEDAEPVVSEHSSDPGSGPVVVEASAAVAGVGAIPPVEEVDTPLGTPWSRHQVPRWHSPLSPSNYDGPVSSPVNFRRLALRRHFHRRHK